MSAMDSGIGALMDPRLQWLIEAAARLRGQLDPGARVLALTVVAASSDGEFLTYGANPESDEITGQLVADIAQLRAAVEVSDSVINLTPPTAVT